MKPSAPLLKTIIFTGGLSWERLRRTWRSFLILNLACSTSRTFGRFDFDVLVHFAQNSLE
jgi:hypothetical protein